MIEILNHHAYGIVGEPETTIPRLTLSLEQAVGYGLQGNPDFRSEVYEVMGIAEARALKEATERIAVSGGKKLFIVSARGITKEAQNALLKVCEEPSPGTHLFLIVPSFELLLPTLRSRLHRISLHSGASPMPLAEATSFLAEHAPARLAMVQEMLKGLEKEKKEVADSPELLLEKGRILRFLDALEIVLAKEPRENSESLGRILEAKKYSHDRAPSLKLLLEHLALVLPQKMEHGA